MSSVSRVAPGVGERHPAGAAVRRVRAAIDALRRAEAPFFEPDLEDLLARTQGENAALAPSAASS